MKGFRRHGVDYNVMDGIMTIIERHIDGLTNEGYSYISNDVFLVYDILSPRERSGSVVECLTRDRRAAGSSLTGVTALWSLNKTHLSQLSTGSTQEDPSLYN